MLIQSSFRDRKNKDNRATFWQNAAKWTKFRTAHTHPGSIWSARQALGISCFMIHVELIYAD